MARSSSPHPADATSVDTHQALATSEEMARLFRRTYERFALRTSVEPTIEALLAVADAVAGAETVLTDRDGNVLHSSRGAKQPRRLRAPDIASVADTPQWYGNSLCATSMTAPGTSFAWVLDENVDDDPVKFLVVLLTAEYASMFGRVIVTVIPEDWQQRAGLVRRMLGPATTDQVERTSEAIGHDLQRVHHVVTVESTDGIDATRLAMSIGSRLRTSGLIAPVGDHLVIVVSDPDELHRLLAALSDIDNIGALRVGVSSASPSGHDLALAREQAVIASRDRDPADAVTISWFDDRDPIRVMVRTNDQATNDRLIDDAIGPLLTYHGPHRDEFLRTLRVWLDSTDSLDAIAERLTIHRSTLVYRLRRIRELLGHDLRDPEARFAMSIALRMSDLDTDD